MTMTRFGVKAGGPSSRSLRVVQQQNPSHSTLYGACGSTLSAFSNVIDPSARRLTPNSGLIVKKWRTGALGAADKCSNKGRSGNSLRIVVRNDIKDFSACFSIRDCPCWGIVLWRCFCCIEICGQQIHSLSRAGLDCTMPT
jgi:hypothetical protein